MNFQCKTDLMKQKEQGVKQELQRRNLVNAPHLAANVNAVIKANDE